jgi:ABC-type uncharacterized transport system permease subunit
MRPQLTFLLPDIDTANQASQALLLARVDNKNIWFLAKPGTNLGKLQAANVLESSNVTHEDGIDILIGASIGLLIGLYVHYFQPWVTESIQVNWIVLTVMLMIFGAAISAIGASIFGTNLFNNNFKKYKSKIDKGAILMIVSAPFQRSNEIATIVSKSYLKY